MLKFLIGPVLLCAGYVAGSFYGSSADQVVQREPAEVFAAFAALVDSHGGGGTMRFAEGPAVPYALDVEETSGERMVVRMAMAGSHVGEAELIFTPQDGGKATLVSMKIHADRAVLRKALAGTPKAKLAYAPDWMLNMAMKDPLRAYAEQIEAGGAHYDAMTAAMRDADGGTQLTPEQQRQMDAWRQYDASRPAVDPDAAAKSYLGGS